MADDNPYAAPDADVEVDDQLPGELATRGQRLGGAIIDGLILIPLVLLIFYLTGQFDTITDPQASVAQLIVNALFGIGLFLLVNGYLLATRGQTVGKRLLGMQIVSYRDNQLLSFGRLIGLRYLPQWVVSNIPLIGGILALVNVLFIFGKERRCIHDLIAGTKVIVAPK